MNLETILYIGVIEQTLPSVMKGDKDTSKKFYTLLATKEQALTWLKERKEAGSPYLVNAEVKATTFGDILQVLVSRIGGF